MDPEQQSSLLLAPSADTLALVKVFPLIPSLKHDVTNTIDSALSWEQLTAADINFSIVRPIVNKYARLKNMSVVYACLVVKSYFLAAAATELAVSGVMYARASLCEILAMKLLSYFATNYIQLVAVLTTSWNPLAGATVQVIQDVKHVLNARDDDLDWAESALEMAISTESKNFLASPVTQQVVNDIYSGRVVFSVAAMRSVLADNYKPRAIEIYDPSKKPFIDHYRLRVPKYNAYLEFINFALLLLAFVLCLASRNKHMVTFWETMFIVLGSAFSLGEYTAATEHGWIIYIANIWNSFDFAFILVFLAFLVLRVSGLSNEDPSTSDMAFDVLACGACILFPRLAFFAISNNMIVLSLRAMISQFIFFIAIASICFSGLLFTLWTLATDSPVGRNIWTLKSIAWLMVQIWFGNISLSFAQAASFHPIFGPILMTIFAALSGTLLLTILISILSNTVARIDANATQEYLFQYTIATIEGVKSDALFSYQPPFNILAFVILKPASWFLTPRALHSVNVFLIKLTSLPQLIVIGSYERYWASGQKLRTSSKDAAQSLFNSLPRHIKNMPLVEALVGSPSHDLYGAIFDIELDGDEYNIFADSDGEHDGPQLWSMHSREDMHRSGRSVSRSSVPELRNRRPPSMRRPGGNMAHGHEQGSMHNSPKQQALSSNSLAPLDVTGPLEVTTSLSSNLSPLARLFSSRFSTNTGAPPTPIIQENGNSAHSILSAEALAHAATSSQASLKQIESLLHTVNQLPVNKLKEEMKELQERQARIESLLMMLTRGMRNETPQPPHRQSTLD